MASISTFFASGATPIAIASATIAIDPTARPLFRELAIRAILLLPGLLHAFDDGVRGTHVENRVIAVAQIAIEDEPLELAQRR